MKDVKEIKFVIFVFLIIFILLFSVKMLWMHGLVRGELKIIPEGSYELEKFTDTGTYIKSTGTYRGIVNTLKYHINLKDANGIHHVITLNSDEIEFNAKDGDVPLAVKVEQEGNIFPSIKFTIIEKKD